MTLSEPQARAAEKAVVKWRGELVTITFQDVKRLICPDADNQEISIFLRLCQSLQLNPFANEIFLIKYSSGDKAAAVISINSYLKAAEGNSQYKGHEAGIIIKGRAGALEFREGAFILEDQLEDMAGGWAKVYRKDRDKPLYIAVNKAECVKYTRDGNPTKFWAPEKQPSMLRKTALKRGLVEAFPSLFAGTVSTDEASDITDVEFTEMEEGDLPEAYVKDGQYNWSKFWARQKEKGLDAAKVHVILRVSSIKEDWIEKRGRTLGQADIAIDQALARDPREDWVIEYDVSGIKSPIDFAQACRDCFHLEARDALRITGHSDASAISDWSEEFQKVAVSEGARIVEPST